MRSDKAAERRGGCDDPADDHQRPSGRRGKGKEPMPGQGADTEIGAEKNPAAEENESGGKKPAATRGRIQAEGIERDTRRRSDQQEMRGGDKQRLAVAMRGRRRLDHSSGAGAARERGQRIGAAGHESSSSAGAAILSCDASQRRRAASNPQTAPKQMNICRQWS